MLIKVIPKARKEGISRLADGVLKVKVSQPAEKGRANRRVVELLAKFFKVKPRNIIIAKGKTGHIKEINIIG